MTVIPGASISSVRSAAVALTAGIGALAGGGSAHADTYTVLIRQMNGVESADATGASCTVTVRQVEGVESVPAHMTCIENKACNGLISISAAAGRTISWPSR